MECGELLLLKSAIRLDSFFFYFFAIVFHFVFFPNFYFLPLDGKCRSTQVKNHLVSILKSA